MSQQNDETKGLIMVVAFLGAAIYAMAIFAFIIAAFASLIMTLCCFFAWNSPLTLGSATLMPDVARAFVYRGLIGALVAAAFSVFAAIVFGFWIQDQAVPYILLGGYTLGSIGLEILWAQEDNQPAPPNQTIIPPSQQITPPQQHEPSRVPFRFASWDDEDGR
ncbi:hypothetical protein [Bosea sp. (in: a-proteobacteria)]|uniref:hypothetical protein n=1 Tax=Bosea sp. (in: a-proteobacteria) TaxID=1871050 RepID=UPI0027331481|nr:hypothetical protein [Bosea sp. (in: a-proteobacteria)]MDP3408561.1 hypothetical protein [Bosea sp. (in: a-proteobacteria)]